MCLLLSLLLSVATNSVARAENQPRPLQEGPLGFCAARSWILEGAAAHPDDKESADLPEAWRPQLATMARCLEQPDAARACLAVQGQFDGVAFPPSVVRAFGSLAAAQQARARGRAARVLQEFASAGVPAERLRELTPPSEPTYRGVAIYWQAECLPAPPEIGAEDRRIIEEARRLVELHRSQEVERVVASPPPPTAPAPTGPSPFFLEGAVHASAGFGEPDDVVAPGLRAALGLRAGPIVARVGVGGSAATREEQRLAGEAFLAAAYQVLPWLEFGVTAGARAGAPDPAEPWLERSWFAGVEATECPFSPWERVGLCFQQALLPLGGQQRRGEIEDGEVVRIPPETNDRIRLELSVALRQDL